MWELQKATDQSVRRTSDGLGLRVAAHVVAEDDGFCDFAHGTAFLAALTLDREIRLLFIEAQIALQDALGALYHFARLQLLRERRVRFFEPREFNFGSDQESDGGDHANFAAAVNVMMAVLQVDDTDHASATHDWD